MPYPLSNEYADRIDKDNWGRNFDPSDKEHCTEKRTTGHVLHALVVYRSNKWQDRLLWGYFQEDFAGWKQETFEIAENADVRALRDHMRMYGVYAPKDGRRIAANLAEIVEQDEYHEWTEDEVNHHLRHYTEFHSRWNPSRRSSTPPPQLAPQPTAPPAPPAPQDLWSQHPPPPLPPHPRYQTTPSPSGQAATPIYSSIEQPPPAAPEAQPQWPQRLDPLGQTIYCSGSTPAPSSSKQLIKRDTGVEVPIVRKWGHPWMLLRQRSQERSQQHYTCHLEQSVAWSHLTELELRQLHRRFGHPSVRRLHKLLQRAGYDLKVDRKAIEHLTKFCRHCQLHAKSPGRFKFILRDDNSYCFNYEIVVDVMYLDSKPVLQIVDSATSFQAARFLKDLSARTTWDTLRLCWIDSYLGPPDYVTHDAGKNFASAEFRQYAKSMAIEVKEVPVEAHNSVGKVERYHQPLRRAYEILREELPNVSRDAALQMAVKATNDSAGPDGLVPTFLVFGAYPRMTDDSPPSASIAQRAEAIRKATQEVRQINARRQVKDALAMRNGPDTTTTLRLPLQSDEPYEKSRLVIQGYRDEGKAAILTQSPTIQRASQRLILALAPSLMKLRQAGLQLRDISQAYTQSTTHLNRTILAELPAEIKHLHPENTLMVVVRPLYGIAEAGTHWWATYSKHHKEKLGMVTSTYDPCLLISSYGEQFGIVGMQTDDTLILADDQFDTREEEELQKAQFPAKPKSKLTANTQLIFNGCVLTRDSDNVLMRQKEQSSKIALVSNHPPDRKAYIEQRARGAYIASICQPEAAFDLSAAAQHQEEPNEAEVTALNKRLQWQLGNKERGLQYIPLDLATAKLFVFVDGSFANNKDCSSQIGYEVFLANEEPTDKHQFKLNGNLIHWSSTKCKRVTRSVLASEIYGMVAGVDMAFALGSTIKLITEQLGLPAIPTVVCTDSFSLYECLVKLGTTKEKRLMIDIMALRQSYERRELYEIRWINGHDNPADAMTKASSNKALETFVNTNSLTVRIEGWVKRPAEQLTEK